MNARSFGFVCSTARVSRVKIYSENELFVPIWNVHTVASIIHINGAAALIETSHLKTLAQCFPIFTQISLLCIHILYSIICILSYVCVCVCGLCVFGRSADYPYKKIWTWAAKSKQKSSHCLSLRSAVSGDSGTIPSKPAGLGEIEFCLVGVLHCGVKQMKWSLRRSKVLFVEMLTYTAGYIKELRRKQQEICDSMQKYLKIKPNNKKM